MNGPAADFQHRQYVGFERITDHQKVLRPAIEVAQELLIIRGFFLAHDLDVVEIMGQS